MAEWWRGNITSNEFITHSGPGGYEIHFRTPDREKYLAVQDECRRQIDHAKPPTNADRIRAMTDEELADWVWSAETAGRAYGPRGKKACLDWLKQEAT
jgi:hypothetical protein